MTTSTEIAVEKYVSLTTFTRDGAPKPLPVWIAQLPDGRLGFTTSPDSWKAKRIANNPKVTLEACDMRGTVTDGAPVVTGAAEVVEGPVFHQVQALIRAKYGRSVTLIKVVNTLRGLFSKAETQSVAAVVITVE